MFAPRNIQRANSLFKQHNLMDRFIYTIAIIIITIWLIGYFGFQLGGLIHLLLVIGLILIIMKLLKNWKVF